METNRDNYFNHIGFINFIGQKQRLQIVTGGNTRKNVTLRESYRQNLSNCLTVRFL